jgi:hypothetical protein
MFARANWWRNDWVSELWIRSGVGELTRIGPATWRMEGRADGVTATVALPEDGDELAAADIASNIEWRDVYRSRYLIELNRLIDTAPEFPVRDWYNTMLSHPARDLVADEQLRLARSRPVGIMELVGTAGTRVDAAAVDVDGNAATAGTNPWLRRMAESWEAMENRPPLDEFVKWSMTKEPYGPFVLRCRVTVADGTVQVIADRALCGTV